MKEYFKPSELACKCGKCDGGASKISPILFSKLNEIREKAGRPLTINSGYRCPKHPIEAAKPQPGAHSSGIAADISVSNGKEMYQLVQILMEMKCPRIGIAKTFIHCDWIEDTRFPKQTIWLY